MTSLYITIDRTTVLDFVQDGSYETQIRKLIN